jgi:glycosyltransferase involved in cell wall biosynthesis
MKASVLVINYNNEKYINKCISSLKNQTFTNLEIIFFDDCSTDSSLKQIDNFTNIKVIKNFSRTKHGSFNQIKGLLKSYAKCTGDIIFFLDSDDFFHPKKVELVINAFNSNPNIKCLCDLPIIYEKSKKFKYSKNLSKCKRLSYFPFFTQQSCIAMKREYFKKVFSKISVNRYPNVWADFRIAIYEKFSHGKFHILEKYLTYYRQTPSNVSSKFSYLSKAWWLRRLECHYYTKEFANRNKFSYKQNLDLLITRIVNAVLF